MTTPQQLRSWTPARLRTTADAAAAHAGALLEQVNELRQGGVPASWTFQSAEAARTALDTLATELEAEATRLQNEIQQALDAAAAQITTAQEILEGAFATAHSCGLGINTSTGRVYVNSSYATTEEVQYATSRFGYVRDQVHSALVQADAADRALAAALTPPPPPAPPAPEQPEPGQQAPNPGQPGGGAPSPAPHPGPGAGGPGAGAPETPGGPGRQLKLEEEPRFRMLPPEEQLELVLENPREFVPGELELRTQEILGRRMGEGLEDLAQDPRLLTDPVAVEEWTGLLDHFGDEPAIMASVFERLEPEGLLTVFTGLTSAMTAGGDPAELARLAEELRSGLLVAGQHPGFDGEAWGRELARYATYDISTAELDALRDTYGHASTGNAAVLDYLLRGGDYGEDFMRGVVAQLDEVERTDPAAAAAWAQRDAIGSPLNRLGDTVPGYLPDPMATAMGRLSEHPYAALRFFTDADDGAARAAYYLGERDWRSDGFGGIAETVLSIGTDRENLTYLPGQAQKVVDTFLESIVANPYFSAADAGAAAGPLAALVEQYLPEVHAAIKAGATELPGPWDQLVRVIASASAAGAAGAEATTGTEG